MRRILTALALVSFALTLTAQESLEQLLSQNDLNWIIGTWTAQTDNSDVTVTYSWGLNKKWVDVTYKGPDLEAKAMTALDPSNQQIRFFGADTRGGLMTGVWSLDDGNPVLRYSFNSPEGRSGKLGVVHKKAGADAMKVSVHRVADDGSLEGEGRQLEMKRKK